jgi:RNA polymerase sigma factor (sigma-70 family)
VSPVIPSASLAERYIPLARKIAARATRRYEHDRDEVLSDALYGLVKATTRVHPDVPFGPYARKWIEGEIMRGRQHRSGVRADVQTKLRPASLDALTHEDGKPLVETLPDRRELSPFDAAVGSELWERVDRLPAKQRMAVRLTYQWDLSQTEIASRLGVSQMQVSRLLGKAREQLAERMAGVSNLRVVSDDRQPCFSLKTLAQYLFVSERTVRQLLADGVIPSFKIAGQRRILASDVDAHVTKQRRSDRGGR